MSRRPASGTFGNDGDVVTKVRADPTFGNDDSVDTKCPDVATFGPAFAR
jgi:hypothetical protein